MLIQRSFSSQMGVLPVLRLFVHLLGAASLFIVSLEPIPMFPLPLGEGWGEGKRTSESIEKTSGDSSHPHPRPLSRRTGEGRLWDRLFWCAHGADTAWYRQHQQALLDGVDEVVIDPGAVPGPLCVTGEKAFPVLVGTTGNGYQPVVVAGEWGTERVVAFGHTGAFWTEKALSAPGTRRFLLNAIQWASSGAVPCNVAIYRMSNLADWLRNDDESRRRGIRVMDWKQLNPAFLSQTHVLILNSHDLTPATLPVVSNYVRMGGGLLVGGLGWGWLQLNPGKSLRDDFPGNLLLADCGIFWADGYLQRTTRMGFASSPLPGAEFHALEAAKLLGWGKTPNNDVPDEVIEQAAQTVTLALSVVPQNHSLRQAISRGKDPYSVAVIPTPQSPLRQSDKAARAMLQLQVRQSLDAEANMVKAHPAAVVFPGQPPTSARTVRKSITIDPTHTGWQSTGLYAVAGRPITVTFDSPDVANQVFVQIGCHTDQLWHLPEWRRVPEVVKRVTVQGPRVTLASPFGGLIYLGMVRARSQMGTIRCQIEGAVEAPMYVHGQTNARDWQRIRLAPAPWAELVSDRIILTLPSEYVRSLEDPAQIMEFWTAVIAACNRLAGGPARTDAQRIVCDVQISAGYMHSGYPIMTHLDIAPVLVNVDRLRRNDHGGVWGLFHEIGHNYQSPDWTFEGTGEVTNNLFTVYVFDHLCAVPREKTHPALATRERLERRRKYFSAGSPFEQWKNDPFLALDMYLQLQEAFGWEPFEKTFAAYRTLKPEERPKSDAEKRDQWVMRFSRAVNQDISPFFQQWGIPLSPEAVQSLSDLPAWQPSILSK